MKYSFIKSIRCQLLVLIFAAILPALGIIIYSNYERQRSDIAGAEKDAYIVMRGLAHDHENAIEITRNFLSTLAKLPEIQEQNVSACNKIFGDLLKENKIYSNISETNVQGKIIASAKPFNLVSVKGENYFQDALRTKEFSIGEHVIGAISGRPSLPFAYPVMNSNGQVKGIILISLDLDKYGQYFVSVTRLSKGWTLNLLDQNFKHLYRYPDTEKFTGKFDLPGIVKYMSAQPDEGIFKAFGVDGVKRLFAYKRFYLENASLPYLYMRVGIPEEQALALAKHTFHRNILLLICSLIAAILIAWLMGNALIVKRLRRLIDASQLLGRGDFTARTDINRKEDELGQLAHSFDQMAESLEGKELERKKAESQREAALEALRKSEERFKQLAEVFPETIFEANMKGYVTYANEHGLNQFGFTEDDVAKGVNIFDMISEPDRKSALERIQARIQGTQKGYLEYQALRKDGSIFHAMALSVPIILDGTMVGIRGFILDITERKRSEHYHEMGSEILQTLNKPVHLHELMQSILAVLKTRTGFDAVGIRLQDGNDFPYVAQSGFSDDFLMTENKLTERDADGGLCHDKDGNVKLECTCGLVISGKTDPANSLFTKGGSFWINDTSLLLDLSADHDPRFNPRNKCIYQGYASLALVPIRTKDQIVGLMQFNNRRKNSFFLADIEQFESIAANIAEALLRKDAENALSESEKRYRFLTDHMADHIWTMDISLRFTYSSPAVIKILGYTISEFMNLAIDQFFTTESFALADKLFMEELETDRDTSTDPDRIRTLQTVHYHKNGHLVWLESALTFIRDASMKPTGILGVSRDITERKQAEEELKKSEEQVRLLLNSTAEAIYGVDLQDNCTFANPSCLRMLGYADMKQLLGKNMHPLTHHSYVDGTPKPVEDCRMCRALLKGKGEHAEDEVFWRADGTSFPVEYWSYPEIMNGNIYGAVVAFYDITERKHAEEQIKHLATHDLLTDLPSLRLARDRMSVAINMARRYNKAAAVMFIDLDGFKAVNDTLGHDAGDYVLKQVAQRLLSCVRKTDTVARVGGDEFLIIATEINSQNNAALIAEKVIQLISKPVIFKSRQAVVSTSIGIALFPDHSEDMDQLIKLADEAMYKVKNAGKNGFRFVNTSIK